MWGLLLAFYGILECNNVKKNGKTFFLFRSKEIIEIYRNVYRVRQQLLSLKEGLEIKKSSGMDIHCEQSSGEHSEDEESAPFQQHVLGTNTQNNV